MYRCSPNFTKDQPWRVSSFIEDDMCSVVRSFPRASWTPASCQDEIKKKNILNITAYWYPGCVADVCGSYNSGS